jgi:hypothetical protein
VNVWNLVKLARNRVSLLPETMRPSRQRGQPVPTAPGSVLLNGVLATPGSHPPTRIGAAARNRWPDVVIRGGSSFDPTGSLRGRSFGERRMRRPAISGHRTTASERPDADREHLACIGARSSAEPATRRMRDMTIEAPFPTSVSEAGPAWPRPSRCRPRGPRAAPSRENVDRIAAGGSPARRRPSWAAPPRAVVEETADSCARAAPRAPAAVRAAPLESEQKRCRCKIGARLQNLSKNWVDSGGHQGTVVNVSSRKEPVGFSSPSDERRATPPSYQMPPARVQIPKSDLR